MKTLSFFTINKLPTKYAVKFIEHVRVENPSGCWVWQGRIDRGGYGRCAHFRKETLAHRFAYAWLVGPIPRGRGKNIPVVDHICKNRKCCNPLHLRLVSNERNILNSESPAIVNRRKTHCVRGHVLPEPRRVGKHGKLMRTCKVCKKIYDSKKRRWLIPEVREQHNIRQRIRRQKAKVD